MLLSAQSIRDLCVDTDTPLISPFSERTQFSGFTYGLSSCGYDIRIREQTIVYPGQMRLASSVEHFIIPNDLLMRIVDKSTWARTGIAVQNTVAEPGWCGFLTLEITNHTPREIAIRHLMPIAQVLFERLDVPTEQPYSGKYQHQPATPVLAIL